MKTECPGCKKVQKIPDHYENKKIRCPFCGKEFIAITASEPNQNLSSSPPPMPETEDVSFSLLFPAMCLQLAGLILLIITAIGAIGYEETFGLHVLMVAIPVSGIGVIIIALGTIAKFLGHILWHIRKARGSSE